MTTDAQNHRYFKKKRTLNYDGKLVELDRPMVMGILNLTADSFFDGGRYLSQTEAIDRALAIVSQGASIIDVGACSTRPGALQVSADVEIARLLPVVTEIKHQFPDVMISIDTYRANVADTIVDKCGACIINDISGGLFDAEMFDTVAKLHVPYVVTHTQGTPDVMQKNPSYENVTKEVIKHLSDRVSLLCEKGVADVIMDAGFGFGKTVEHNYELFSNLDAFRIFELPMLVGISRKSMIYKLLNKTAKEALNGTTVLNAYALNAGADILRVHDVAEAVETVAIYEQLNKYSR